MPGQTLQRIIHRFFIREKSAQLQFDRDHASSFFYAFPPAGFALIRHVRTMHDSRCHALQFLDLYLIIQVHRFPVQFQ
jgi:hypothetical protein